MMTPERTLKVGALADSQPAAKESRKSTPGAKDGTKTSSYGPPPVFARLIKFFSSLRLTVVCLGLGLLLVFAGTLAQVHIGTYEAQNEYFRRFFIYWAPKGAAFKIPIFPGGYLLGGVLLINLVTAHVTRFKLTRKKAGIWLIHIGLILLLVGQLVTDLLARESALQLFEGEAKNFSEDFRDLEVALIDRSAPDTDLVYSIPQKLFERQGLVHDPRLPLAIRINKFWVNADVVDSDSKAPMAIPSGATAGEQKDTRIIPLKGVSETDKRNMPAAVIEVEDKGRSLGSFFTTALSRRGERFAVGDKDYEVALRFVRYYHPFSLTLLKATHQQYRGTDTPKNFASRIRVENANRNEARERDISMNNPLRYGGLTFYQYQMTAGEVAQQFHLTPSSTFQVVRNPGWLTPYASCILIALGLMVQFLSHLFGFVKRRSA